MNRFTFSFALVLPDPVPSGVADLFAPLPLGERQGVVATLQEFKHLQSSLRKLGAGMADLAKVPAT